MQRVVVLGRGGAGKSTMSARLAWITGLPVLELDSIFWRPELTPTPPQEWISIQAELTARPRWIMDGDLGPYDCLRPRLAAADTVLVLDFSLLPCAWRAARRSRERADFWWWLLMWRRQSRPALKAAIAEHAPAAEVHVFRGPRSLTRFLRQLE